MELGDAILLMRVLHRDLPQAAGTLSKTEEIIRSVRDGAGQIMGAGIKTQRMGELHGMANAALEDLDRVRAKLVVISRTIEGQLP